MNKAHIQFHSLHQCFGSFFSAVPALPVTWLSHVDGRACCLLVDVQLMLAVGVVAVPSALIANGFFQILEDSRKQKHARRRSAAVKLQATVRSLVKALRSSLRMGSSS